jgi:hypothetical protein
MRVVGVSGSAIGSAAATRRRPSEPHEPDAPEAGRALIAVNAPRVSERLATASRHAAAPFLAQLIATHMQAPQTRTRRRAEPAEAVAVYRANQTSPRPATGAIQREV